MKLEPLKNKVWCIKHEDIERSKSCKWVCNQIDIKSAVEWLKEELELENHSQTPSISKQRIKIAIDLAFEDVV